MKLQKRIAIIGTRGYPSYYGGFETAVRRLAPYLADQGWEVTVYGRDGATRDEDPEIDARIHRVVTKGLEFKSFSTLTYGLSATIHALRHRPDAALIMNCANGFWLPLLKVRGIPTAVNVDGIEWERAKWGATAKAVFKLGARMTAAFADLIIADAHEIARRWLNDFHRESVFIPYGGDPQPPLEPPQELPAGGYILVVARFVPENSISEFFESIRILNGKYPVVIVGTTGYGGPLDEECRALADRFDNVTWMGHVSDDRVLNALWQNAGAYFHGHSVGGTNPALVQAMACGAPIVARDTPYNREVLGDTGRFVEPHPAEIAKTLEVQLEQTKGGRFDAQNLLQRSVQQYSWESVCRRYHDTMLSLTRQVKSDH